MDTETQFPGRGWVEGFSESASWASWVVSEPWTPAQSPFLEKESTPCLMYRTQTLSKISCKLCWAVFLSRRTGWLMSKSAGFRIGQTVESMFNHLPALWLLSKQQTCWALLLTRKIRKMHQPSLYGEDYMRSCGQVLHSAWVAYSKCSRY